MNSPVGKRDSRVRLPDRCEGQRDANVLPTVGGAIVSHTIVETRSATRGTSRQKWALLLSEPLRVRPPAVLWALVSAAVLIGMALLFMAERPSHSVRSLLARVLASGRPVEARFVSLAYAPFKESESAGLVSREAATDVTPMSLARLAPQIRKELGRLRGAARDREAGVVSIFTGTATGDPAVADDSFDKAVASFEAVAKAQPDSAVAQSDLGAAYFVRGQWRHDPLDLLAALAAADQALDLDPGCIESRFNRALVLEALSLWYEAEEAWEGYLEEDRHSEWAAEARAHLATVEAELQGSDWAALVADLEGAARAERRERVHKLVAAHPELAREHGETVLLGRWAEAKATGRSAEAADALAAASAIGDALAELTGDHLLLDAVSAARHESVGRVADLVAGYRAFGRAAPLLEMRNYQEAEPLLQQAARALGRSGSPLQRWVDFYLADTDYQRDRYESAYLALDELITAPDAGRYPSLLARALRLQGLIHRLSGNYSEAQRKYEVGVELAHRAGEVQAAASMQVSLARVFDQLGDGTQAWRCRAEALAARAAFYQPDRLYLMLAGAAVSLRTNRPRQALTFQSEAIRVAETANRPIAVVEAFRERSSIQAALGQQQEALADLERSSAAAERVDDESIRVFLALENRRLAGHILAETDPYAARTALDEVVTRARAIDYLQVLPATLLDRARVFRRLDDETSAEQDLRSAVAEVEAQRTRVNEPISRVSYFDEAQAVYDELTRLLLDRGDSEEALAVTEQSRGRLLLDRLGGPDLGTAKVNGAAGSDPGLDRAGRFLSSKTALVEYAVLEDRIEAWVVTSKGATAVALAAGVPEVEDRVQAFRDGIGRGVDDEGLRSILSDLYRDLIEPLEAEIQGNPVLVFVPHKFLWRLPLAALWNERRGRYLIQDFAVGLAPSAELLDRGPAPPRSTPGARVSALIVGEPAFDRSLFPDLEPLPAARKEVESIARLYSGRTRVLVAEAATREAFLALTPRAEVVHFAGHGVVDASNPLHSKLLLAREERDPRSVSWVTAEDLLGLDLAGVRLAVLSACSTAGGLESPSEGVLSLVWPFLVRGVPSVVASLWPVEDGPTADLMLRFHDYYRASRDPLEALRRAQMDLLGARSGGATRLSDWAAFESFGGTDTVRVHEDRAVRPIETPGE